jgi:hypothetical protein
MALRWAATAFVATEKHFRRIMGYKQLWILKSYLGGAAPVSPHRLRRRERPVNMNPGAATTFNYERDTLDWGVAEH